MIDAAAIDELVDWMIDGARPSASARQIIEGICRRSSAPACRSTASRSSSTRCTRTSSAGASPGRRKRASRCATAASALFSRRRYSRNPLPTVTAKQVSIRRRLNNPECSREYVILGELAAEGFTDYLAQPLVFTTGETHGVDLVDQSDRAASAKTAIDVLERIRRPLARLVEAYLLRLNAASILSAYVGRNSGDQILQGRVHRGDGEEIDAAILFTDLIGFTALSNTQDRSGDRRRCSTMRSTSWCRRSRRMAARS